MGVSADAIVELESFRIQVRRMDRTEFIQRFQRPFLIQEPLPSEPAGEPSPTDSKVQQVFATTLIDVNQLRAIAKEEDRQAAHDTRRVIAIAPRGVSAKWLITVGRTENCDVILMHSAVSKLHAFFRVGADGDSYAIMDNGSRNGTSLDGAPLPPKKQVPLRNGHKIVFGAVVVTTYLTPAGMYELATQ